MSNGKFKTWFRSLSQEEQEEVIRIVIKNKPPGRKLKDIMGYGKTDKTFDLDLVNGQAAEIAFLNIATSGKHEVKRDFKVSETGNIAIEVSYKHEPSGLSTTKSPYWVYWLSGSEYQDEVAVIITAERLKRIIKGCHSLYGGDNKASKLYLVPIKRLLATNSEIE